MKSASRVSAAFFVLGAFSFVVSVLLRHESATLGFFLIMGLAASFVGAGFGALKRDFQAIEQRLEQLEKKSDQ